MEPALTQKLRTGRDGDPPAWPVRHGSYVDFYQAEYASSIVSVTPTAAEGVQFIESSQGAGDWSDQATPDLTILSLLSASAGGRVDLGAGMFRGSVRKGQNVVTAPGTATSIYIEEPHRIRVLVIRYASLLGLCVDQDMPRDGDFGALHAGALTDPLVHHISDSLWAEAQVGSPRGAMFVEGALLMLAATLAHLARRPPQSSSGGLATWQLRRTTDYLNDHLAETVSLTELAAIARLSVFHFARAFKTSTGQPPHRYQTRLRMDRAQDMLQERTASITEIALGLGYESSQSFARAFRLSMECSPSEWRRRHSS